MKSIWGSSHITGMAEPKVLKPCKQVGYMNSSSRMTSPTKGSLLWSRDCCEILPFAVMKRVARVGLSATAELLVPIAVQLLTTFQL